MYCGLDLLNLFFEVVGLLEVVVLDIPSNVGELPGLPGAVLAAIDGKEVGDLVVAAEEVVVDGQLVEVLG